MVWAVIAMAAEERTSAPTCAACGRAMEQWWPQHWRCRCGQLWIDRPAIYRRLEAALYEWPLARARVEIPVPVWRPDTPRVDGGWLVPGPEHYALEREREAWVVEAIDRAILALREDERRLVRLRYEDRRPWPRVAAMLGLPERTMYRMRERVLERLAVALGWIRPAPPRK